MEVSDAVVVLTFEGFLSSDISRTCSQGAMEMRNNLSTGHDLKFADGPLPIILT